MRAAALGPLVRILHFIITSTPIPLNSGGGGSSNVDLAKVMETLSTVIRVGDIGSAAAQLSEAEVDAVSTAISTITVVVQRSGKQAWGRVSASFPLDVLVGLVLDR
jgi:hypothetical protein